MPSWPGDLPGQHKRLCITPSTSFLFLLASSKTEQPTQERTFSLFLSLFLSLYPVPIPAADTWTSQHERAYSTLFLCFLLEIIPYQLFLPPKSNGPQTSGGMLNSCSAIYNCFLLPETYSKRVSFCLKLFCPN